MFVKEITVMNFDNYFPVWNELNTAQKKLISDNLITQHVKKGTVIHNGNLDCTGLLLVKTGQLRTYILSDEGREITLYLSLIHIWGTRTFLSVRFLYCIHFPL